MPKRNEYGSQERIEHWKCVFRSKVITETGGK